MNTSDVLNKAADLIEERGWTTGNSGWQKEDGPLCLEGGIIAALGLGTWNEVQIADEYWACPAYNAVAAYLGRDVSLLPEKKGPREPLWQWNDHIATGEQQVIATLRAAAVIEAAKENASAEVAQDVAR